MIGLLMLEMTAAGLLILAAAALLERGASQFALPRRWCWLAGMTGMLAVPALATVLGSPSRFAVQPRAVGRATVSRESAGLRLHDLKPRRSPPLSERLGAAHAATSRALGGLDSVLLATWVLASGVLLVRALRGAARLERRSRSWRLHQQERLGRPAVWLSDDVGPAAFGVSRGAIVIPQWVNALPHVDRRLLLLHERSHVAADDPQLVWIGTALVILLPWHLPLRCAFRRLQRAIEHDCDRRVLSHTRLTRRYADLLLHVASRRMHPAASGWRLHGAHSGGASIMSFAGGEPELALRLRALAPPRATWRHRVSAIGGACVALPLVLAAAAVPMPSHAVVAFRDPQIVTTPVVTRDFDYLRGATTPAGAGRATPRNAGDSVYFARADSLVIDALRRSRPELLRLASTVAPYVAVALNEDNTVAAHSIRAGEPPSVSRNPVIAALRRAQAAKRAGLSEQYLDDVFAAKLSYVSDNPSEYLDSPGISHLLVGHDPLTVFWVRFKPRSGD